MEEWWPQERSTDYRSKPPRANRCAFLVPGAVPKDGCDTLAGWPGERGLRDVGEPTGLQEQPQYSGNRTMNKRALLIGSSFSAAPMLFRLKRRGIHVSVCGSAPSDPCHQYGDASFFVDYSKREALLELVKAEGFDYIVPTCNDYSYMSGAWVADQIGLPGFDRFEVAEKLHTKDGFRGVTNACGTPAPRAIWVRPDEPYALPDSGFPLLVKPVDSFSGRGVTKVEDAASLDAAVRSAMAASRSASAVIENFVEGDLYSHSAYIKGGKVAVDFFVDEFCTVYPYQVNCSNYPSRLPDHVREGVREAMNDLIARLDLVDGLLHTQFISNGRDFWIIECMRRCPGDLYGGLVERSEGIDYTDMFVQPFIGEELRMPDLSAAPRSIGRHTISFAQPLVFQSFSCDFPGSNLEVVPLKNSGESVGVAPFDKLAITFHEYASADQMFTHTPKLHEYVRMKRLDIQQQVGE
ncbi:MAG: ATP-grasp domain-containing protein [Aquabacterium sp.]|uniref:ATP-grasp domain-containing protein n=1 Tax=Aquabacterium sp. TaxID=1872578 RepID=UPI0025C55BBD|nr:ATP-grasp domain-containing protein [Aquabacterium sp.]MBI5925000.1 ATP-grasp domain-containing protein [Aquabacterium sp.]